MFIPLDEKQEEALSEMYNHLGFAICQSIVLKYLEENLGKFNIHTVNLRISLEKERKKISDKASDLSHESKLTEVLLKRS